MFENIISFFKRMVKDKKADSKDTAKERLHLVLMQDRANVSADFLELMKQEIIDVIKKYIDVDENSIDVRLTNKSNGDGTTGAPILYANIPIVSIKDENKNKVIAENKEKVKEEKGTNEAKKEEAENKEQNANETKKEEITNKEQTKEKEENSSNIEKDKKEENKQGNKNDTKNENKKEEQVKEQVKQNNNKQQYNKKNNNPKKQNKKVHQNVKK